MSLIDQALKKTQSALHHQKSQSTTPDAFSNAAHKEVPRPSGHHLYSRKRTPASVFSHDNIMSIMTHRWMIGLTSFIFAISIALVAHHHLAQITHRYENFYEHLYQNVSPQKHSAAAPIKKAAAPRPVVTPLELEGTLQVGNEHVAMINQELLHKNEIIDGYQVEKVNDNVVDLQNITTHQERQLTQTLSK